MKLTLPQSYINRLWRTIIEFDMLQENDHILVGLSGGKDSLFLTYALAVLRQHSPRPFQLSALTIDPLFAGKMDMSVLQTFCDRLDVPFYFQDVDIAQIIANANGKDPCFSCAFFRRGAMNRFAKSIGSNKIALAHHYDDAVETYLMSILFSGQVKTFLPVTFLDRTGLTVIRPLVYFREKELTDTAKIHGCHPVKNPCPYNGKTKRQETKDLLRSLYTSNRAIYSHLASAMRQGAPTELWPKALHRDEMKEKHYRFWSCAKT